MKIRINGKEAQLSVDGLPRFTDVIELIKASIDPDHILTGIFINEREVQEDEWAMTVTQMADVTIDVTSGSAESYVSERLDDAPNVVRSCFLEFRDARKSFQDGDMQTGNRRLKVAVDTLRAFFEWYGTLMQLVPEANRSKLDITPQVKDISETCKRICQQQLYQSWWALGESLEKELEPQLDKLEDVCRRAAKQAEVRSQA